MRKAARQLPAEEAEKVLKACSWGTLGLIGDDDFPYTVPLNYVYTDGCIFFHCASEGYKLECIKRNPKVSFTAVEKAEVDTESYSTFYRSVTVIGTAEILEDSTQRYGAVKKLCEALGAATDAPCIEKTLKGEMPSMTVVKIIPAEITGKQRI